MLQPAANLRTLHSSCGGGLNFIRKFRTSAHTTCGWCWWVESNASPVVRRDNPSTLWSRPAPKDVNCVTVPTHWPLFCLSCESLMIFSPCFVSAERECEDSPAPFRWRPLVILLFCWPRRRSPRRPGGDVVSCPPLFPRFIVSFFLPTTRSDTNGFNFVASLLNHGSRTNFSNFFPPEFFSNFFVTRTDSLDSSCTASWVAAPTLTGGQTTGRCD